MPSVHLALAFLAQVGAPAAPPSADDLAWFENEVRPVFAAHCASCHGGLFPDADLDLESTAGLLAARDEFAVVVPGDPDASRLIGAVRYTDPTLRMPPTGRVPDAALAVLEEWVRRSAPLPDADAAAAARADDFDLAQRWASHWSWRPVTDPATPALTEGATASDPLDAFLLARLAAEGLAPAPGVDDATWLRRASFAATGLPPSPADLAALRADRAPGARARAVDRLLGSPHYGERFARHWLDLVRYAETKAHEFDFPLPHAHAYRDYLVRAFEADVPYDRFVLEHLAGDLLADAPEGPRLDPSGRFDESVLGTGWWHLYEDVHSPVDTRADECDRVANQVDTLGKAFLAQTVACARCHDHKFDALSAEDYHALAGFALSSSYAQVRYETRLVEADVARALARLDADEERDLRARVAEFLASEVAALEPVLADAFALVEGEAGSDAGVVASQPAGALEPWLDVVLEDFEREDFAAGGIGPWTVEGEAFVARPLVLGDAPAWQDLEGWVGERFVNSHAGRGVADAGAGDAPTGRLVSAPFALERRHLHFLVSGGDHAGTAVVLELETDGGWREVQRASGRSSNRFAPRRFDVAPWLGRRARIALVDAERGGWGHLGFDHLVASDDPSGAALSRARTHAHWQALRNRAGAEPERAREVLRAAARLERARGDAASADALRGPFEAERVLVDYAAGAPLLQNGSAFRVVPAGALLLGDDGGLALVEHTAARAEPGFGVLVAAPDSERHGGDLSYDQAGTTLLTPTFVPASGSIAYLVRGRARVFACVDSHRMLSGPLHLETLASIDTGGAWAWVEHDLTRHVGAHVHVEFTAAVDGAPLDFALARVVEAAPLAGEPSAGASSARAQPVVVQPTDPAAPAEPSERAGALLADWRRALGDLAAGRAAPTLQVLLDDARREGRLGPLAAHLAPLAARRARELARLVPQSRLAPALIDLVARDEFVLRRGDPHSPTAPAPRRDLAAARLSRAAGDEPFAATGSGRLALARAWIDPRHPLVARVWVNRVWHHLFGRGLVATCDDFGAMGALPTHPELLDALARDFVASGWSTKALVRRILLSEAFARASAAPAEHHAIDPENLWLARGPVRRVEAEAVRDALLATSGALDPTRFGVPVPVHLSAFMNGRGRPDDSGPLDGANRRSLYLAVRRNFVTPFMAVFDFPVPSATRGVRSVSNVPAQALALANDPFVSLCAERFGARALAQPLDDAGRVDFMFEVAFARTPNAEERRAALAFLAEAGADDAARREAFADLAHTLYTLEEFLWLP